MLSCRACNPSTRRGGAAIDGIDLDVEAGRTAAIMVAQFGQVLAWPPFGNLGQPSGQHHRDRRHRHLGPAMDEGKLARATTCMFVFQFATCCRRQAGRQLFGHAGQAGDGDTYGKAAMLLPAWGSATISTLPYPSNAQPASSAAAGDRPPLINDPRAAGRRATSDLDEQTEIEIMDMTLTVNQEIGTTLVLVAHNLALARRGQVIVYRRRTIASRKACS